MGKFLNELSIKQTNVIHHGRAVYVLTEPLKYELGVGHVITVPIGFITDLASTSWPLWIFLTPSGRHAPACVLHDYLFLSTSGYSRLMADAIFLDALESLGVSWLKRKSVFLALRCFGWIFYPSDGLYG